MPAVRSGLAATIAESDCEASSGDGEPDLPSAGGCASRSTSSNLLHNSAPVFQSRDMTTRLWPANQEFPEAELLRPAGPRPSTNPSRQTTRAAKETGIAHTA